ncbi:hypothetical protein NML43_10325 [Rhodopseudomonas palustris]|uniref:hypothetical protein n=1 Tax=Rhodopseudomonas palustris TaxID=1076 RepID=UPI0020CCB66B|nr:hypothetical protein [Rhodopseudomonas palustris]MCP9627484.1 hypothetical protein [Rhodopseudomonas palustris]
MSREQTIRQAADRLLGYLESEFEHNGSSRSAPGNVQFYYKMPAVFALGGRRALAHRTLTQLTSRFMPNGVFDLSADPVAHPWTPYLGGWAAWGAAALGRFDIARQIMRSVIAFRDPGTGGYGFSGPQGKTLLDLERSGAALMGAVWSGDLVEAHSAADFLRRALAHQPELDKAFYAYLDAHGHVVPDASDRNAYFDLTDPFARPAMFATGIAGLVWLARASADPAILDLAENYLRFVMAYHGDVAALPLSTKLGWSALMLHAHRPDPRLSDLAQRSADDLVERQKPDGSIDFDALPDVPKPIEKVWLVGWDCDCALTLMAVADDAA